MMYRSPSQVAIKAVNKRLGEIFKPLTLDDSDWGVPLSTSQTVRSGTFSQVGMTEGQLGISTAELHQFGNNEG